jgi:hypothetical protein
MIVVGEEALADSNERYETALAEILKLSTEENARIDFFTSMFCVCACFDVACHLLSTHRIYCHQQLILLSNRIILLYSCATCCQLC